MKTETPDAPRMPEPFTIWHNTNEDEGIFSPPESSVACFALYQVHERDTDWQSRLDRQRIAAKHTIEILTKAYEKLKSDHEEIRKKADRFQLLYETLRCLYSTTAPSEAELDAAIDHSLSQRYEL